PQWRPSGQRPDPVRASYTSPRAQAALKAIFLSVLSGSVRPGLCRPQACDYPWRKIRLRNSNMTPRTLREFLADPKGDGVAAPRGLAIRTAASPDACRPIEDPLARAGCAAR